MSLPSGGKSAQPGDGPAGDAKGCDERHTVRVAAGVVGGVEHQAADLIVAAQVAPDLLGDQLRGLRAQHRARAALMGLELVKGGLDLPALRVGGGQLGCGGLAVIEQ